MSEISTDSARAAILNRVRQAVAGDAKDRSSAEREAVDYLRAKPRGPQPSIPPADLVQRFIDWSIKMGSTVDRIASVQELPAAVARYCLSETLPPSVVVWPAYGDLNWASAGLTAANRPANGDDKTSVTGVTAGIAETGTILITPSAESHTAAVLLPDSHIAVVHVSQIVATMEDAMERALAERGSVPRAMNFIAGPSRTADIEQTLVIGAHGPIRVHVVVMG